jgi:hypothetical protein
MKDLERMIEDVNASMAMEGMPLTNCALRKGKSPPFGYWRQGSIPFPAGLI